jgi:excinuclease ABC subunit A
LGNTLVVVEHDEDTIKSADYVVDIGPGAGIHGGKIIAQGTPEEVAKNKNSLTGRYLAGEEYIEVPKVRREKRSPIILKGCAENNLKNINVEIPTECLTLVTGVSGSGKSTLVNEILYKGMMKKLHNSRETPGKHKSIFTESYIDKVLAIDQSPIGKTPRSNPATYIGVFDEFVLYLQNFQSQNFEDTNKEDFLLMFLEEDAKNVLEMEQKNRNELSSRRLRRVRRMPRKKIQLRNIRSKIQR